MCGYARCLVLPNLVKSCGPRPLALGALRRLTSDSLSRVKSDMDFAADCNALCGDYWAVTVMDALEMRGPSWGGRLSIVTTHLLQHQLRCICKLSYAIQTRRGFVVRKYMRSPCGLLNESI